MDLEGPPVVRQGTVERKPDGGPLPRRGGAATGEYVVRMVPRALGLETYYHIRVWLQASPMAERPHQR